MDTSELEQFWRKKSDEELVAALIEIGDYEEDARRVIEAEARTRPSINVEQVYAASAEERSENEQVSKRGGGCLRFVGVFGVVSLLRGSREAARRIHERDYGGAFGSLLIPLLLLGWYIFASLRDEKGTK